MDKETLEKANELERKINNINKLIEHFLNDDGTLKHKEDQSVEVLVEFFTNCRNLTGNTNLKKIAYNIIDYMITDFSADLQEFKKQFKEL